jgi:hypothetical protein
MLLACNKNSVPSAFLGELQHPVTSIELTVPTPETELSEYQTIPSDFPAGHHFLLIALRTNCRATFKQSCGPFQWKACLYQKKSQGSHFFGTS